MCIGLPMQLIEVQGHQGLVRGRGREEVVDLRLVGDCPPGSWLLIFNGAAREWLDPQRAAEIDAALDLLEMGMAGVHDAQADPGFVLPSAMSAEALAALTGQPAPPAAGKPGPSADPAMALDAAPSTALDAVSSLTAAQA
ncbi:MAG: HypC/HybG/HupF family hydrogenase formation chaperone [Rubrivivax sp.]|nr:HypC/HybG/HupF family hydrogenase formation chaperone [Rubrivivax sp.]